MHVLIKRPCPENYQKFAYLEMLGCILEDPILIIKFLCLHPCFEYFTLHWEKFYTSLGKRAVVPTEYETERERFDSDSREWRGFLTFATMLSVFAAKQEVWITIKPVFTARCVICVNKLSHL